MGTAVRDGQRKLPRLPTAAGSIRSDEVIAHAIDRPEGLEEIAEQGDVSNEGPELPFWIRRPYWARN
jgi:hypothetical protein